MNRDSEGTPGEERDSRGWRDTRSAAGVPFASRLTAWLAPSCSLQIRRHWTLISVQDTHRRRIDMNGQDVTAVRIEFAGKHDFSLAAMAM